MPENCLKSRAVSYAEFLHGMAENADAGTAALDSMAALSLIKNGVASRFPSLLFSWGTMAFVATAFILPFFFSWAAVPICLFFAYMSHRAAKIFVMRSAWRTLLGRGKWPVHVVEWLYAELVARDLLWSRYWDVQEDDRLEIMPHFVNALNSFEADAEMRIAVIERVITYRDLICQKIEEKDMDGANHILVSSLAQDSRRNSSSDGTELLCLITAIRTIAEERGIPLMASGSM